MSHKVTVAEIAKFCGVSLQTVLRWIEKGDLHAGHRSCHRERLDLREGEGAGIDADIVHGTIEEHIVSSRISRANAECGRGVDGCAGESRETGGHTSLRTVDISHQVPCSIEDSGEVVPGAVVDSGAVVCRQDTAGDRVVQRGLELAGARDIGHPAVGVSATHEARFRGECAARSGSRLHPRAHSPVSGAHVELGGAAAGGIGAAGGRSDAVERERLIHFARDSSRIVAEGERV